MFESLLHAMADSILDGDPEAAAELAKRGMREGLDPLEAINKGFVPGMTRVGESFSCGEAFLPDLVLAGEAMKAAATVLDPELVNRGERRESAGSVVIGTVEGDIHDIGKSLVGTMLSANGFQVYDLGVNVPAAKFAEKAREVEACLVGLSALLTTTMVHQKDVVEALADLGLRPKVKVMVGGAPVTREWAEEIGADGYGEDAVSAVALARRLTAR